MTCTNIVLRKNLCTKCNINYYPKENDPLNVGEYINCYNQPQEGYYFDGSMFKNCYFTCKKCEGEGNELIHNCIECNENFSLGIKKDNYFNCYENCNYYHYFDNENNFHCTLNLSCPKEYPILNENKMECIKYNIQDIIKDILNNGMNETEKSKEDEIKFYDNILNMVEKEFISDNYNTSKIDNGEDEIIKTEKMIITLTTTENQKNNINNKITKIYLDDCEILLRNYYNISDNETLYIKKIDAHQEGTNALKIEYDVYAKLFRNNLIKLNLTICEKSKISVYIPIIINEPLDEYNSSSGYYNDICYTITSEDGTDILLKDRQNDFIDKDKIV